MVYIYVNDYHEALYFIRGTDAALNAVATRPLPLRDDLSCAWRVATGGRETGRLLVADHATTRTSSSPAASPNGPTQHRHRQPRRGRAGVLRRTGRPDAALVAQTAHGAKRRTPEVAPGAGRTGFALIVRRLRTDPAACIAGQVHAAERAAGVAN